MRNIGYQNHIRSLSEQFLCLTDESTREMVKESTHPSVALALASDTNARDKISSARRPAAQKDLWRILLNFDLTSPCMLLMESTVQVGQLPLSSSVWFVPVVFSSDHSTMPVMLNASESTMPLPMNSIGSPVSVPLRSGEFPLPLPLNSSDSTVHPLFSSNQSTSSFRLLSSSGISKVC